jgi:hypothetical protein
MNQAQLGMLAAANTAAVVAQAVAQLAALPPPGNELGPDGLPDCTRPYLLKDAALTFLLTDKELDTTPYLSQRNHQGPYPIRIYQGADLLAAAVTKCVFAT